MAIAAIAITAMAIAVIGVPAIALAEIPVAYPGILQSKSIELSPWLKTNSLKL
jgi:hypothetical protein